MQIPPGYRRVTFSELLTHFAITMPLLGRMLFKHIGMTEIDGRARIADLEAKGFVQFAISPEGQPSSFSSTPSGFNSVVDKLVTFWDVQGKFDVMRGDILSAQKVKAPSSVIRIITPEGDLGVVSAVAAKLFQLKLVTEDEQGRLHAPSRDQVLAWVNEHGICDFCSDPHPVHAEMVPDFEFIRGHQSVGGWASCDICHEMIRNNQRAELLQRSIAAGFGGPQAVEGLTVLHQKFWQASDLKVEAAGIGAALVDFIEDRLNPEQVFINPKLEDRKLRVEAIQRLTGLTSDEMDALCKGNVLYQQIPEKLSAWRKKFNPRPPNASAAEQAARQIVDMLNTIGQPRLPPANVPHWQQALDQKVKAINELKVIEKMPPDHPRAAEVSWMDLRDDLMALRVADAYSFSAETMHAIMTGAKSIPCESDLKSVELPPVRAGWFWFAEPYPIAASPIVSETTAALLWTWDTRLKDPSLRFSTYVVDDKTGSILPATKWIWPVNLSVHDMLGLNTELYRATYGENGPFHHRPHLAGEAETMKVVLELSLFFLMACLWFRQTVPGSKKKIDSKLTQVPGHIERHARKRIQKELKLDAPPLVRVIALRKSAVEAVEHTETDGTKRTIHVRFVVSGHARLQPYGPARSERKLIWIDPFVKGRPDDPFKPPSDKVFAVVR